MANGKEKKATPHVDTVKRVNILSDNFIDGMNEYMSNKETYKPGDPQSIKETKEVANSYLGKILEQSLGIKNYDEVRFKRLLGDLYNRPLSDALKKAEENPLKRRGIMEELGYKLGTAYEVELRADKLKSELGIKLEEKDLKGLEEMVLPSKIMQKLGLIPKSKGDESEE